MFVAGEKYVGLQMTTCFFRAARRWRDVLSVDARGCCWVGQRRCDARFGRGKIGVVIAAWLLCLGGMWRQSVGIVLVVLL